MSDKIETEIVEAGDNEENAPLTNEAKEETKEEATEADKGGKTEDAGDETEDELSLNEKKEKVFEIIKEVAEDGDGLDIYQLSAFRSQYQKHIHLSTSEINTGDLENQYFGTFLRSFICGLTQFAAMGVLIYSQFKDAEREICEMKGDHVNRVMVFCFSLYISLVLIRTFNGFRDQGLYQIMEKVENWDELGIKYLDVKWIKQGKLVNSFVLLASIWTSWLIIFLSEEAIDIILNSLAVFFITELDDFLVDKSDYRQLNEFVETYERFGNRFYEIKDLYYIFYKDETKMSEFNKLKKEEIIKVKLEETNNNNEDEDDNDEKGTQEVPEIEKNDDEIPQNDELRNKLIEWCQENIYNKEDRYVDELMVKFGDKKFEEIGDELEEYKKDYWYYFNDLDGNEVVIDVRYEIEDNDYSEFNGCEALFIICTCGIWYCAGQLLKYAFIVFTPIIKVVLKLTMLLCFLVPIAMTVCY